MFSWKITAIIRVSSKILRSWISCEPDKGFVDGTLVFLSYKTAIYIYIYIYTHTHIPVTDKPIPKTINSQLDIKQRQFMEEELNIVLTKIKNRKAAGLNELLLYTHIHIQAET